MLGDEWQRLQEAAIEISLVLDNDDDFLRTKDKIGISLGKK